MQDTKINLPRTKCPTCGKITPKRDIRDRKPQFCSRVCAQMSKFKTRYQGTMSGPYDRPIDVLTKTKWNQKPSADIPEPGTA